MVSESTQPEAKMLLVVDGIDDAADGVRLLTLRAADGADLPEWAPGAHLDLVLGGVSDAELKDAEQGDLPEHDPFDELIRQYSLCGDPADRSRFQVAVLRESESRGGSSYIHETLKVGDELVSYGPRNHFELRKAPTYVFVAGGIGITPILTMVRAAQAQGKNWHLYYLGRSGATMAFRDELASFGDRVTFWPKADKGAFDLAATLDDADAAGPALVYSCGPERLLAAIEDGCKSRANLVAHVERFSPKEIDDSGNTEFDVILEESDMRLTVPADRSIFEVVREAGVSVLGSCLEGICGTCETGVIAGEIDHRDSVLEDDEREEGDIMMICVSRCKGKELTLEL